MCFTEYQISISGFHITMVAWLAGLAVATGWRRSQSATLWLPAQQAARWGAAATALAYAVFSGWGVPSQRTVWMLATVTLLQSLGRRWPWPLVLLAAAVVVTLADPLGLAAARLLAVVHGGRPAAVVGRRPGCGAGVKRE